MDEFLAELQRRNKFAIEIASAFANLDSEKYDGEAIVIAYCLAFIAA